MQTVQLVKVLSVGSSLGIVIPAHIAKCFFIERGDHLAFAVYDEGVITLRKISKAELLQLKPPIVQYEQ